MSDSREGWFGTELERGTIELDSDRRIRELTARVTELETEAVRVSRWIAVLTAERAVQEICYERTGQARVGHVKWVFAIEATGEMLVNRWIGGGEYAQAFAIGLATAMAAPVLYWNELLPTNKTQALPAESYSRGG